MDLLKQAIEEIKGKRVLVAPLNWGLGHATRCVPIINMLLAHQKEVILAADGLALDFLKQEFPSLPYIFLKGIHIKYNSSTSQVGAMLQQLPGFIHSIKEEHKELQEIIKNYSIDTVISDNRFGLWSKRCESIYMTHQLMVKMTPKTRWLESTIWYLHHLIIKQYDHCWIPDFEGQDNLAGDLTHKYKLPKNNRFIGVLSRFHEPEQPIAPSPYHTIVLISGPEPQRSMLEERAIHHFRQSPHKTLILRGQPHQTISPVHIDQITLMNHMTTTELQAIIPGTEEIVCRSGYSSLMDLYTLQHKATLIPTPGQTEQIYLAHYWQGKGYNVIDQQEW